ncbi:uncharacterized protein LOC119302732 [Triticum dicoccoides]|uniref:uncharacterized protein LOC119302732 n=1 Tax=Triticum dicoccoides TaxID=85692 RepID=UPI00188FE2B9|nr:uncharacterized protein LOC119302732 [Triticum dicoccoides]
MAMRAPVDDAMRAVFMRLPADDPRSLARAAAVCRSWRGILTGPGFADGYRALHGGPPMLGFLHNEYRSDNRFVPTSTFRRRASQDSPDCQVLDSRHGLVLLYAPAYDPPFEARDLVTGDWWDIDDDPKCRDIMHWPGDGPDDFFSGTGIRCNATVLCAKDRCGHLDCHGGGPFLVALVGSVEEGGIALATVYSSETCQWSDKISVRSPGLRTDDGGHTAVVGDKVYVPSYECDSLVEFNIREQQLSVINVPENLGQGFLYLIGVEDGMLLFASVLKPRLYLLSMEAGPRGAAAWARRRVVELEPLLPPRALLDMSESNIWAVGFAEGVSVIFLRTPAGCYAIDLNSGRANKVGEFSIEKVMPYARFCTGGTYRLVNKVHDEQGIEKVITPMAMPLSPPPLVDDAMRAVFMRLPADDPRSLIRAAAVCRGWRAILSDPCFARGYRALHGAPPMLGFLHNEYRRGNRFVSTSTFRRPASHDHRDCHVLDSRHGLALLYAPGYHAPFDVCDLVTDNWREIDDDPKCHDIMHWPGDDPDDYYNGSIHCNATVFCAIDRCDHLDCHGGPFLVALVGSADEGSITLATVYSSETRQWSDMISVQTPGLQIDTGGRTAVVGNNKVYVPNYEGDSVVEYNIREQQLSVIKAPEILDQGYLDLLGVEDGMLLFASVRKPRLYLWSMEAGPGGAAAWTRRRVVELEPLLPPRALLDMSSSDVWTVGFAEGVRVIFLRTPAGLYAVELNSGRANKMGEFSIEKVMPYTRFCIGAWGRLPASDEAPHAVAGGTMM